MPTKDPENPPRRSLLAGEVSPKAENPLVETSSRKVEVRRTGLLLIILAAISIVGGWIYTMLDQQEPSYEITKTIRYSFQVTNNTAQYIDSASLKVFAPVKQNSYQKTEQITANQPFEIQADQSGNQSLLFHLSELAPHASRVINITAVMRLADSAQRFGTTKEAFLSAEPNIEVDAPEVKALAGKLDGEIWQITAWLYKNVTDIGYIAEDRGARYAITGKQGDCTEFSAAFVALARASGVPSKMIGGFRLKHSGKLQAENYHNWAEYKREDVWGIADPQNNIVDSSYESYIAFYNFDKHSRLENSQRFLSYDRRLSVQML